MNTLINYIQLGCISLLVLVFVSRALFLWFGRQINPIVLGVGKSGWQKVRELSFIIGLLIWVAETFTYALNLRFHFFGGLVLVDIKLVKWVGVGLVTAGLTLFTLALVSFGNSWRVGIDERKPGNLVTGGVFAYSRNPIYLALDMYFTGTFLINGSLFFLITTLLIFLGMHYQILQEESFLESTYGNEYLAYHQRTARYLYWKKLLHL